MIRTAVLLTIFFGGYFTAFPVMADVGCSFDGGNITLVIPKMSIPADTPDGTILYSSPNLTKRLTCEATPGVTNVPVQFITTADYNSFLNITNGIRFTVYIDGYVFNRQVTRTVGYTSSSGGGNDKFSKNMSISYDIRVDKSRGAIPVQGTMLSGGFESLYAMLAGSYNRPRGVISLYTPDITYIPCSMDVSVRPDTIDFGAIKSSDLEKGKNIQRTFFTLIKKSKGCSLAVSAPFGINMFFETTNPVINADGSLKLNDGVGLSIADSTGRNIAFNTAQKIDDVKVDSILKNDFRASLHKVSGQDIKTGPFSADVVVRLSYY
ncbi:fimbrial protein [Salmonella enterica]|nr:fimbrial protein [Salmonella enterica]EME5115087.1 fimbrial protein [Salmonella enterica]